MDLSSSKLSLVRLCGYVRCVWVCGCICVSVSVCARMCVHVRVRVRVRGVGEKGGGGIRGFVRDIDVMKPGIQFDCIDFSRV